MWEPADFNFVRLTNIKYSKECIIVSSLKLAVKMLVLEHKAAFIKLKSFILSNSCQNFKAVNLIDDICIYLAASPITW